MSYAFTQGNQYGSQFAQQPQTQQYTPQQLQYMQQQMTPQQRLQLMEQQQQQQFAPQQPQQQPQSPYLRGSPVTCVEDARAQMVGMDGAPSYFPDLVYGKAEVLLKNGLASNRGYWCGVSDVAGRMYQSSSVPSTTDHNREIGHSLESKTSGTNVLSLVQLHFN